MTKLLLLAALLITLASFALAGALARNPLELAAILCAGFLLSCVPLGVVAWRAQS